MRAAPARRCGPPDAVVIADAPARCPGPGEVLVRVTAAPVTRADARIRALDMPRGSGLPARLAFGLVRPRHPVQGMEFAGIVQTDATGLEAGTRVMGLTGLRGGAHADALAIRADGLVLPTPDSLTDTEAAAFFFGGLTAAHFLIDAGRVGPGSRVLVNGATGAVGSAALARDLGAQRFADRTLPLPAGPFHAILDVAGTLPAAEALAALAPEGRLLCVTATFAQTLGALLRPLRQGRQIIGGTVPETREGMKRLLALHAAGGYRPLVGAVLPFDAIALAGSGGKQGSVVLTMASAT